MTMRAGPHIRAEIDLELGLAQDFRDLAKQIPHFADILLEDAARAEARARRWAAGTDYVIDGEKARVDGD